MKKFLFLLITVCYCACSGDDGMINTPIVDPMDQNNPMEPMEPVPFVQQDLTSVDQMVTGLMTKYAISGASLAIGRYGKLVYQKGYGFSEKDQAEEVTPQSVFRLASLSKTYTAAGILKLADEGAISLNDKVFGTEGLLGDEYGMPTDVRVYEITVDQLLYNIGGGWGVASGGDPIDYAPEKNQKEFIEYLFSDWPLAQDPGTAYVYSNTGYWLLARIIERESSMSFEQYLNDIVLKNSGITTLHRTNFKLSDKQPNEVTYYDVGANDGQYIYDQIATRRDGDGGLISSAPDVLRFVNGIDGFSDKPDILSSGMIQKMQSANSISDGWGRGHGIWASQNVLFMYGSLPGTRTGWMRHDNGTTAVLLFNGNASHRENFVYDIQDVLLDLVNKSTVTWQDFDQLEAN